MITRPLTRRARHISSAVAAYRTSACLYCTRTAFRTIQRPATRTLHANLPWVANYHTSPIHKAQGPTADALMEDLNDLYATAKDEFEIASEETEKKTVYAAEDREAAREALTGLQEAYNRATTESDPEVAKEVQGRVGSRIRELENAVKNMEERAMED